MEPLRPNSPHSSPFAQRSRPNPGNAPMPNSSMQPTIPELDLRELEYLDPDSHLSCPICHVPFIDPVSVDCGHYFCAECLARYWETAHMPGGRRPCPTCRSNVTSSGCAPRLIVNMCDDVQVKCPVQGCGQIMTRSTLGSRMVSYCPEQLIECPRSDCKGKTKRKHFLQGQCRHRTHLECECGDLVSLDVLEGHRRLGCSLRVSTCLHRQWPVGLPDAETHSCEPGKHCPGKDFGCDVFLNADSLEEHLKTCTIAKMAPHLKAHVTSCLAPLQDELLRSRQRVQGLEEGIDKMLEAIDSTMQEYKKSHPSDSARSITSQAQSNSVPAATSDRSISSASSSSNTRAPVTESAEHQHLLALHANLRKIVEQLDMNFIQLSRRVGEVDARNSMLTMNEIVRLKEELTVTNNGLFSTRAQVQWLLSRERTGQRPGIRGTDPPPPASQSRTPPPDETTAGANGSGAGNSRPLHAPPTLGRTRTRSGGSQDRVKL